MSLLSRTAARMPAVDVPILGSVIRGFIRRSFGEPPLDPEAPRGDAGIYGPGSASWEVLGDTASIIGGVRSLLLQLTHPLAMAGVANHSRYLDDPLGRLQHTAAYFALLTFGSTEEVVAASQRVRRIHGKVVGTAPDGRPYDASSPELLAWVSVTATASFLSSHAEFGTTRLTPETADAFVAEQARGAALLDPRLDLDRLGRDPAWRAALAAGELDHSLPLIADGWLPTTRSQLEQRLLAFEPDLAVGQQGRTCLRFLLWPPVEPPMRVGYLPILSGALATLDAPTRRLLGIPLSDPVRRAMKLQSELALITLRTAAARRRSPNEEMAEERLAA